MKFFSSLTFMVSSMILVKVSVAWITPINTERATGPLRALKVGKNYTPKWKKKETLAEQSDDLDPQDKGIVGTVPIVFKTGDSSISTVANPGDSIRDVASQAGQFIQYGCGKGDCGTCQAKCGGQWIRPCIAVVPADILDGESYVIEVKEIKNKARSSGKFYSVRSFLFGFYNNVLGMFAFVRTRGAAKKNFEERIDYEAMIAKKTAEKKAAKLRDENMRP